LGVLFFLKYAKSALAERSKYPHLNVLIGHLYPYFPSLLLYLESLQCVLNVGRERRTVRRKR
jgi:hypothetical protein